VDFMFIGVVGIKGLRFVGVIFTEKRKGAALLQPLFLMAEEQGCLAKDSESYIPRGVWVSGRLNVNIYVNICA